MVNFLALLLRRTVSTVMTQAAVSLKPRARLATTKTISTTRRAFNPTSPTTFTQPRRQYQTHQQHKQQLKRQQAELEQQVQSKSTRLVPITTPTRHIATQQSTTTTPQLFRRSYRGFASKEGKWDKLDPTPETTLPTTTPTPATPAVIKPKTPSLYSRIDDKLVSASNVAGANIQRKLPRGKIVFFSILFFGTYFLIQNRIMRNSTRWVNNNVINMKRKQISSLSEIASLSAEDIFHVFQTIYPDLTSNGMLPLDRISHAIYDEIDDCRDDRKLAENKLRNLVTIFVHDSQVHFARLDKEKYESELTTLAAEIKENLPPNAVVEFDPTTFELNLAVADPVINPSPEGVDGVGADKGGHEQQQADGTPVAAAEDGTIPTTPTTPTTNHPIPHSDYPNPEIAHALDNVLFETNLQKEQTVNQMNQLVDDQHALNHRVDLTSEERQVEVAKIQHKLTNLQSQLSILEDKQHDLRAGVFRAYEATPTPSPDPSPNLSNLMTQYGNIFTERKNALDTIKTNQTSLEKLIAELPENDQISTQKYLQRRRIAERATPNLDHKLTHIHNSKDQFRLTALDLDPETMPTLEDAYSYNYFNQDNDEYKISTWTMLSLFKNLPTGTAGEDRYVKFHDAVVATSILAKTQWSPADPHYKHYIKPDVLRKYYLNVQRSFRDYLDDPLCRGGIVSLSNGGAASMTQFEPTTGKAGNIDQSVGGTQLSTLDQLSQTVSKILTPPKWFSDMYTSEATHATQAKADLSHQHYETLHFLQTFAKMIQNGQNPTSMASQIKFDPIYSAPLDRRIAVLGEIFSRHHPECQWESVPMEVKVQLAERFEHLRRRALSQFGRKYDYNPKEPIRLAWASMFPPDPLQDTPQAHNQYRRGLGGYDEQMKKVENTLEIISEQPLSRQNFEKLIGTMCNAGHFKSRTALLTRTNKIWPIAYHTTSPQVIAQAYYDVLDKEVDESITLEEFHQAASHWGKVGRYNLWYYSKDLQGEGDKISAGEMFKLKWGEKFARLCYHWTGVPTWLSDYVTNTKNGKLNLNYLDLQERFIQNKLGDSKKEFITNMHNNHTRNESTLSQFSSHSRNVTTSLLGEGAGNAGRGKKGEKDKDSGVVSEDLATTTTETEPSTTTTTTSTPTPTTPTETTEPTTTEDSTATTPVEGGNNKEKKKRQRKEKKNKDEAAAASPASDQPPQQVQVNIAPTDDV